VTGVEKRLYGFGWQPRPKINHFGLIPICLGSKTGVEYQKQPGPKALTALVWLLLQRLDEISKINFCLKDRELLYDVYRWARKAKFWVSWLGEDVGVLKQHLDGESLKDKLRIRYHKFSKRIWIQRLEKREIIGRVNITMFEEINLVLHPISVGV